MLDALRHAPRWILAALLAAGSCFAPQAWAAEPARLSFELDVMPILTAAGCNQGACHGKARGQNGFQLSLLGFDADADYRAITQEGRGRRVFPAAPEESLLLRKASAQMPHGGGKRIELDGEHYATLRRWIADGMPRCEPTDPTLVRVVVTPAERPLEPKSEVALTVTAVYSDGSKRDVTTLCAYQSSESAVAAIDAAGRVKAGALPGEATIMARYMGMIATWNAAIPWTGKVPVEEYAKLPRANFIDDLVWKKLQQLGITPSSPASDSTLLRRTYLDVIGRLPSADEARAYLIDKSPGKHEQLVDALLARPEYADYWANKWADLLRPNPYRVGIKSTLNFDAWIRDAFRRNLPYDEFVRQLVTARGSTWSNGATVLFRDRRTPDEITPMVSQLFLGVRLECAKCHHHPFEVWGQDDFAGLAAYFAKVGRKGQGISAPISGGEEVIFTAASGKVLHPLTGKPVEPKVLFGSAPAPAESEDPRQVFAAWLTSDDNKYFAEVAVNRVWAELMGRGLVDPVDDLRATNPPSNPPLLAALAADFRSQHYDLKQLVRRIATSQVYRLSSVHNGRNAGDTRNYSRHYRQRLRAEVLLDAVCDATGSPEKLPAMAPGSRAMELWTHRVGSLFLDAFGRPDPNQDPPCERVGDTSMVQTLHLMNSPELHKKVTGDTSRAVQLAAGKQTPAEIVETLYLTAYSRFPTAEELAATTALYDDKASRRRTTEDLLWAMLNTPEFVFKD